MNEAAVLSLINLYIVANGNNEITADVLRPVLVAMLQQPNDKVGELGDLDTSDQSSIVNAINELVSSSSGGFTVHAGTQDPNVTPPGSFGIGDWYVRNGSSLYQYNGDTWVLLQSSGTISTDDVAWLAGALSNIPVSTNDLLTLILTNIDSALGNRYTETEADNLFATFADTFAEVAVNETTDELEFYDNDSNLLFSVDITYFVSQAVTVEVESNSVLLKDKDDNTLSSAALPGAGLIEIDSNPFRYVVGHGNDGSTIQIGDIAAGGIFTFSGTNFFGDLICIDDTGDITTGIGTKWQPLNATAV